MLFTELLLSQTACVAVVKQQDGDYIVPHFYEYVRLETRVRPESVNHLTSCMATNYQRSQAFEMVAVGTSQKLWEVHMHLHIWSASTHACHLYIISKRW